VNSQDETLKQMWPDGAQSITSVTKRPVTAGMDFKNSIIALVEKNLAMKVFMFLLSPYDQGQRYSTARGFSRCAAEFAVCRGICWLVAEKLGIARFLLHYVADSCTRRGAGDFVGLAV